MSAFDLLIDRVLAIEGGYVDNPADPGGETQWGISKRSYPTVDIKGLTRADAVVIYRRDFWDRCHGDEMHPALAYQALDFAVNSGIETAVRKLQAAAGVADDGHWGPATATAVKGFNPAVLAFLYLAERLDFMRKLKAWKDFGSGWAGRIAADMRFAANDVR